nr:hypothetical protein [Tanacetum cinerariifolium]
MAATATGRHAKWPQLFEAVMTLSGFDKDVILCTLAWRPVAVAAMADKLKSKSIDHFFASYFGDIDATDPFVTVANGVFGSQRGRCLNKCRCLRTLIEHTIACVLASLSLGVATTLWPQLFEAVMTLSRFDKDVILCTLAWRPIAVAAMVTKNRKNFTLSKINLELGWNLELALKLGWKQINKCDVPIEFGGSSTAPERMREMFRLIRIEASFCGDEPTEAATPYVEWLLWYSMLLDLTAVPFLVHPSGWTRSVDYFLELLSAMNFSDGGFCEAAIAEGLNEVLMMCPSPIENQTQQNEGLQRHCILVAAKLQTGKPNSLLTLFFALGSRDDSSKRMNVEPVLSSSITARWKNAENLVKRKLEAALKPIFQGSDLMPDEESTGSTSIRLEESSREPNAKKSVNSELGFPVCSSKSENHQEPSGSLSMTLYSPSTLKRHERPTSLCQKSSSSPLLLEGPKSLCTHETDVDNPHDI